MGKQQFSIYIDEENLKWLQDHVREGNFESVSDGIRKCLAAVKEHDDHFAYLLDL